MLGIAGNIRDSFTLTACEIRISANHRGDCVTPCVYNIRISANTWDCVMLSAHSIRISANECDCFTLHVYDITTGAKVRDTLPACETELRNFTIHISANIKIIVTP